MRSRREFLRLSGYAGIATLLSPGIISCSSSGSQVPEWMTDMEGKTLTDPGLDAIEWFKSARFGMFIHYGVYSLPGRGEWIQFTDKIPVKEYEKLKDSFYARDFDPDYITDLLQDAGMKYINFVAKHHDSFCLWDTRFSCFNSMNSPAGRDLVGELSEQCYKKGIALFLSYSLGRDWRHPHAPDPDRYKSFSTRPAYSNPETHYKYGEEHDLNRYIEFAENQIMELMSNYGNIAGIWLSGSSTILSGPVDPFRLPELYEMIKKKQPQALISNGPGVTGTEDYLVALRKLRDSYRAEKPIEICDTMQSFEWGYSKEEEGKHKDAEYVIGMLRKACHADCNLLLSTGLLPGGGIHPEDIKALKGAGKSIRRNGLPLPVTIMEK